ncbi:hypothetical protein J7T55_010390 [Diaporthe amygdali]|uniref:uncharacterized protein n=1 Tax=Phomopsis amygdali TaxID=1214568 RepID=UPI0022FF0147|nr:uncharacterized protein J7T55_010390 [Diaporthe amygdali]KAJ0115567.1 hypothetical protein J7T55_010390 [Diaporthe amygdali]
MPPKRAARIESRDAQPSQISRSPSHNNRAVTPVPDAVDARHDQPISILSAPVYQHLLAQYYRNGEYSDLEVVSNGVVLSVHRIVVCSESPVLKDKCSNLGRDQRLELHQYDTETLDRVLDFCYRRTYSDGEYPDNTAPFPLTMTAGDVNDALEKPLVVLNDIEDTEWMGLDPQCEVFDEEGQDGREDEEDNGYLPSPCEIDHPCDDVESLDEEELPANMPSDSQGEEETPQPPYAISLFANFNVYIAAKELQIPALQLLARLRFTHSLRSHWARFADLPTLIEQVYLRTDSSEPLRALISQMVAAEYGTGYSVASEDGIRALMARNGEFARDVLDTTLRLRRRWADSE